MAAPGHYEHHFLGGAAGLATLITTFSYAVFASYQVLTDTRTTITDSSTLYPPSHLPPPELSNLPISSLPPAKVDYGFRYPINGTGVTWSECVVPADYYAHAPQHTAPVPYWLALCFLLLLGLLSILCLAAIIWTIDALQARFDISCRPKMPRSILRFFDYISNAYASYTQNIALASLISNLLGRHTALPWWMIFACLVAGIMCAAWHTPEDRLEAAQTELREKDEEIAMLKTSQSRKLKDVQTELSERIEGIAALPARPSELKIAKTKMSEHDEAFEALQSSLSSELEVANASLREEDEEIAALQVSLSGAQSDLETALTEIKTPRRDSQAAQHVQDPALYPHFDEGDEATLSEINTTKAREGDERPTNDLEGPPTVPCADPSGSPTEGAEGLRKTSSTAKVQSSRIPRSVAGGRFEDQANVAAKSAVEERTTETTNTKPPTSDKITLESDTTIPTSSSAYKNTRSKSQHSLDSDSSRSIKYAPKQLGINCYWRGAKDGTNEMLPCTNIAKGTCVGDPSRYQENGELTMTRNANGTEEDLFRGRRTKGDKNKQDAKKAKVCVDCWNRYVDDGTAYGREGRAT